MSSKITGEAIGTTISDKQEGSVLLIGSLDGHLMGRFMQCVDLSVDLCVET